MTNKIMALTKASMALAERTLTSLDAVSLGDSSKALLIGDVTGITSVRLFRNLNDLALASVIPGSLFNQTQMNR
jgi:hypothetical protein